MGRDVTQTTAAAASERLPTLAQIPPNIISLFDYEGLARERLSEQAWIYLTSGAGDGLSVKANRAAFDALQLAPRVLAECRDVTTEIELLGMRLPHPILFAPVSYQRLFHEDGERAAAVAAAAMGAVMVVSTEASVTLEEVAAVRENAPQWFQLYFQPDRGLTAALVERAEAAGYRAIVVTVDAPLSGIRNAEQRVGLRLPPGVAAVNLERTAKDETAAAAARPPFETALAAAPTWEDIEALVRDCRLPIVLKGVLSPQDAVRAAEAGVAGVIVSNHGGRILDTVVSPIAALPRIADAVGGRIPLLLDGGVRRGTDIVKALAYGAHAVLIGRPYVMGLAAAGSLGAAHVVKLLCQELTIAMGVLGFRTPSDIRRDVIF
jgi:4-hydroxymandelate oxidase